MLRSSANQPLDEEKARDDDLSEKDAQQEIVQLPDVNTSVGGTKDVEVGTTCKHKSASCHNNIYREIEADALNMDQIGR